jgi:hypothetical protein
MTYSISNSWKPGFEFSTAGFLRLSATQVGADDDRACLDFISLKSRPAAKIGAGYIALRYPPFEAFPLGIVKDSLISTINQEKVIHEFEDIETLAEVAIDKAIFDNRSKVEKSHRSWAIDALIGFLKAWEQARVEDLKNNIDFTDFELIQAFDITDEVHTEWFAWGIYLTNEDNSIREFRSLKFYNAGIKPVNPIRLGIIARILADGVSHSESNWNISREPINRKTNNVKQIRIREIGCLDNSQQVILDIPVSEARILFETKSLPIAEIRVQGGSQKPGAGCRGCKANTLCSTLPLRPGLLGITAFSPWPKAYSPSKFHTFRRCPRQYFLQDELGLRTKVDAQSSAQQRGILVHTWLEQAHQRNKKCVSSDLVVHDEDGSISKSLGWTAQDFSLAQDFLSQHIIECPIDESTKVVTEVAIEALDTDADITVSTRPDVIYVKNRQLFWRETKTVANVKDLENDMYFNIYPQIPLAIRLLVEDCVPPLVKELLGSFDSIFVELELISPSESKVIVWDCLDEKTKLNAWSQLGEQVDTWASETLFPPSSNPPCNWCRVSKWCEFANSDQVRADIGGIQIDLKTGEIIESASVETKDHQATIAQALGLAASLTEISETDDEIPF